MWILFLLCVPFLLVILLAFTTYYRYPDILPRGLTLNHFSRLFVSNSLFYKSIIQSLLLGLLTALFATGIGMLSARAFVRYLKLPYILSMIIVSLPILIPTMPLFLGIHQVALKLHMSNTLFAVAISHVVICLPYTISIFINYYKGIPLELEELARTLGARKRDVVFKLIVPLLRPAIMLSIAISYLISGTEYFSTFLIGGGSVISLPMLMYPYITNNDYGLASMVGIVFMSLYIAVFYMATRLSKSSLDMKVLYF